MSHRDADRSIRPHVDMLAASHLSFWKQLHLTPTRFTSTLPLARQPAQAQSSFIFTPANPKFLCQASEQLFCWQLAARVESPAQAALCFDALSRLCGPCWLAAHFAFSQHRSHARSTADSHAHALGTFPPPPRQALPLLSHADPGSELTGQHKGSTGAVIVAEYIRCTIHAILLVSVSDRKKLIIIMAGRLKKKSTINHFSCARLHFRCSEGCEARLNAGRIVA